MAQSGRTLNFTQGVIWKQIIRFALPLLASSLIQLLYNTVDLIFVGQFVGKEASAAVGASSMLITLLVGLFTGLSVGVSVVVSKAFGGNDANKVAKSIRTAVGISVYGGAALMVIGLALSPSILRLMNTPDEILKQASAYLRIYFVGIIAVVTYNMCSGCLRAVGNSKFPMIIQVVGGVINIILDAFFVVVLRLGVTGVAYATVIGQIVAALASLVYLTRSVTGLGFNIKLLTVNMQIFKEILQIGIPAGIQSMVITLSNVLVQSQINSLGVDVIAAFTAYFKVELIIYLPIMAFGQTMTTFVGQNMGAGKTDRVKKGFRICTAISVVYAASVAAVMLFAGRAAFSIFTKDAIVVDYGMKILTVTFPCYWIYSILENISDMVRGAGNAIKPMIIILLNICVLRTCILYLFMFMWHSISSVAAVYPISWATAAICLILYYRCSKWSRKTFELGKNSV